MVVIFASLQLNNSTVSFTKLPVDSKYLDFKKFRTLNCASEDADYLQRDPFGVFKKKFVKEVHL